MSIQSSGLLRGFMDRIRDTAVPSIERATVLLVRLSDDEKILPDRSGVLLRHGDDYFIITCSHNLKKRIEKEVPLLLALPTGETPVISLHDADFHGTETDLRDICIVRLSPEGAGQILGRVPIELPNVAVERETNPGVFLLLGYPSEWFEVYQDCLSHPPVVFLTVTHEATSELVADLAGDSSYGMSYDASIHALFRMTSKAQRLSDRLEVSLPSFAGMKGISGCGVWRLCDATPEAIKNWTVEQCKLAAIEHRYDPGNGFVHATWIDLAMQRMATDYPTIAAALELAIDHRNHRPERSSWHREADGGATS